MSAENSIEVTGDTIEKAVAKGLDRLGVRPMDVMVEVLEEPSEALFGLPARPARVRLLVISRPPVDMPPPAPAPAPEYLNLPTPTSQVQAPISPNRESRREEGQVRADRPPREGRGERSERRGGANNRPPRERGNERGGRSGRHGGRQSAANEGEFQPEGDDLDLPLVTDLDEIPESAWDDEAAVGKVVVNEMLERMDIQARIVVRRAQASADSDVQPWVFDIMGSSASRLIGRRGETLASLQYLARLIISREIQRRSDVIVDVESYKARRAKGLHSLALRMADDAVQRGRTVSLEPMPPHERRIIHLALRERDDVETRSVGEGADRKVTIIPRQRAAE